MCVYVVDIRTQRGVHKYKHTFRMASACTAVKAKNKMFCCGLNLPAAPSDINSTYGNYDFCLNRPFLASILLQNILATAWWMTWLELCTHSFFFSSFLKMSKLSSLHCRSISPPIYHIPKSGSPFQSNCLMESKWIWEGVWGGIVNHNKMMKEPNGFRSRSH